MIFTIGAVLFLIGYLWYRESVAYKDWRDSVQFLMIVIGLGCMATSILILAWYYLP
jgi:hypothetical protein